MQPITAPVGYWKLDDATGSTGVDEIDNIHPVSLQSSPSWTTGNFGGALAFNGSNYANTSLHFSPSGTISLWAYPTQSGDWQSPAGWKLLGAGNGFALIDEGSGGHWRAVFNPDLSGEKDVVASNPIVFNQWSYLTMTWSLDSNSNAYTVHLYVNGVDQGSIEWDGVPGSNGLGGFNIGKSGDYPDNFFNGNVDEVRVFDYALTPEQVAAFAAETSSTTPPVLSSPITAGKYSDTYPMPITFTLPDDMKADTLVLTFTPAVGDPIVIHLKDADSHHPNTFHITPEGGIKSVQEVKNSTSDSIPDGTYSVSLSYRNMAGDPTASTTITGVAILPPLNALAEVTPIASQTTAANAVYTFSNSESNGQYDFTPVLVSPAPNNPVSVHLNPVTHQVTFTGLQVGSTYSTSFTYIIGTQQSNVLTVGPFTVIPDSQTSNGGSAAPVLIAQSSNNNGGNANGVVVETDSGCVQGNTHSATTGISCPTSGVSSNSQTTNDQKLFLKNLKLGMDDPDVARLQHFLATHGFPVSKTGWGSLGHEATTYGKKTQIALAKFQKANGIKPASGYFGPQTRKFVNAMILANK